MNEEHNYQNKCQSCICGNVCKIRDSNISNNESNTDVSRIIFFCKSYTKRDD